ncbi:MAG: hypothetical protein M3Q89_01510, partial [Verrucomicrobiota bacterium]|nr:hypothetical protein [Verrucomicrobiota bacterium]
MTRGLEILGTIPQLNTTRVRYGRLEDLRDSIAASSGDYASVEGNLWLSIPGTSAPLPDPNNQGGRAPFGQGMMNAINATGDRTHWARTSPWRCWTPAFWFILRLRKDRSRIWIWSAM